VPTTDPENTHAVFKAYDVRGTVPDQIDEQLARRTGAAFVALSEAPTVVVGHDMRPSSPALAAAFAAGAAYAGADTTFTPALTKVTDFLEGSGGKIIAVLSLAGGIIGMASGRFSLGQVALPVGVGIGVGTGVPIVTSTITALI
jgi:hypothetical protein